MSDGLQKIRASMDRESLKEPERWHGVIVEIRREGCRSRERAAVVMGQLYTLRKRSRLKKIPNLGLAVLTSNPALIT